MAPSNVSGVPEDEKTIHCKWRACSTKVEFKSIEEVLDHVLQEHIPKVVKDEDGEDEVVCEWDICETSTNRGDLDKKTAWMQNHFKTRHAKKAKTFKCLIEGCHAIRATSQEIETHVRLSHLTKKKSGSNSSSKESSAQPEVIQKKKPKLKRIWKFVNGRLVWRKPPKVTKRTVVLFADGPRVVLPPGVWAPQNFHEIKRGWTPSSYHSLYNPNGKRHGQERVSDSEEEEEEEERKKSSKKKVEEVKEVLKKRKSLDSIVESLVENHGKTRKEIRLEKEEPAWNGSFWWKFQEAEKQKKAAEVAKKLEETAKKPVERQISEPPRLSEEPVVTPKRFRAARKMPNLTAHYEESVDSESDDVISGKEESPIKKALRREVRKSVQFEEPEESEVGKVQELSPIPKKPVGRPRKHPKKPEEGLKRSDRTCRPRFSLHEVDEDFEKTFELEIQKRVPEKVERPVTPLSPRSLRNLKSPKLTPMEPEVQETIKIQKSLKTPRLEKFELKCSKRAKIPKSPETERRPKRACRALGSMEEVPYMMEIGVEFSL